ncbi:hypothetical protein RUM8411_02605 [Ruegeria meonggei]|uniref:Glyoxalase-like domain protein n=1 Tax=Ruegeria meonggei TaxID=1446476 RepID=A0A1X6ZL47_9RHOB|nr:hypothetical protein RUM8411_02605 [Ruegeria meonggei]
MPHINKTINYVEFLLIAPAEIRRFYETVFGWEF